MDVFKRPYWIYLAITAPQIALVLLYLGAYNIIGTLLEPENISAWIKAGALITVPLLGFTLLAAYMQAAKRQLTAGTGALIIAVYCAVVITFFNYSDGLIPFDIPAWMFSRQDLFLAPVACSMPAVLYGMLLLVTRFEPRQDNRRDLLIDIGVTLGVPGLWYLIVNVFGPIFRRMSFDKYILWHLTTVLAVTSSLALMFFIIRLSWRIARRKMEHAWLMRLPFALLLPLTCFIVYNSFFSYGSGFLGNIAHPAYYLITLACGVLVTIPPAGNSSLRFALLAVKAACWPFVLYFFVALLPFLPIALFVIIAFGFGFLLLGPTILIVLLTKSMADDLHALKGTFSPIATALALLCALLLLPVGVTAVFNSDRAELDKALAHVYEPDYTAEGGGNIRPASIKRVLENVRASKRGERGFIKDDKPYITSYYNWLVLDSLTLSNRRLMDLEMLFTGSANARTLLRVMPDAPNGGPEITRLLTKTAPSGEGPFYVSTVDMEITGNEQAGLEYVTSFKLPPGAWISGYYLVIEGVRVDGLLTDKRAATWVYRQIVSQRRDPGIMYYTKDNRVALRVFPFAEDETRTTGFEITHRSPVRFQIDGRDVFLKTGSRIVEGTRQGAGNVTMVTPSWKTKLRRITRQPYYHFILDMSAASRNKTGNFIQRVRSVIDSDPLGLSGALMPRMTLASYRTKEFSLDDGWESEVRGFAAEGGFNLEHALKSAMLGNYLALDGRQPVFVVVTDELNKAVFASGMSGFEVAYPEGGLFFVANVEGMLDAYQSLHNSPVKVKYDKYNVHPVLAWPDADNPVAYLPDNGLPSVVLAGAPEVSGGEVDNWQQGLDLYGRWVDSKLRPESLGRKRLDMVKGSLKAHIMTPYTSFISLESEAQRRALIKKQKEILSTDKTRDLGEEQEMSEPPLWLLLIILALGLGLYMRKCRVKPTAG